jgi:hypothetical protein
VGDLQMRYALKVSYFTLICSFFPIHSLQIELVFWLQFCGCCTRAIICCYYGGGEKKSSGAC